ncbi:MAG: hypothetical protein AAFQ64_19950 [Pseudomonadota bacterium]
MTERVSQVQGQLSKLIAVNLGLPLIFHFALLTFEPGQARLIIALSAAAFLALLNLTFFLKASRGYRIAFAVAGFANLMTLVLFSNISVVLAILILAWP